MKTLKKENSFKRVKDSNTNDLSKIDNLLNSGWEFCSKSEWKKSKKTEPVKEDKTNKRNKRSKK